MEVIYTIMSTHVRPHRNLLVWQEAIDLVKLVYKVSNMLPKEEKFGIISQMRRAATSIPSNIAEGAARKTGREFLYFLHISSGSISELDTLNVLIKELGFIKDPITIELELKLDKVSALLNGLIAKRTKDVLSSYKNTNRLKQA